MIFKWFFLDFQIVFLDEIWDFVINSYDDVKRVGNFQFEEFQNHDIKVSQAIILIILV